jgi:hypothetical protein
MIRTIHEKNAAVLNDFNPCFRRMRAGIYLEDLKTEMPRSVKLTLVPSLKTPNFFISCKFSPEANSLKLIQKYSLITDHPETFVSSREFHVKQLIIKASGDLGAPWAGRESARCFKKSGHPRH